MRLLDALGSGQLSACCCGGCWWPCCCFGACGQFLVVLLAWSLQGFIIQYLLAPLVQRPRPFGVAFRTDWYAWALSQQLAALAFVLVGILYGLVPEGRWRQTGKWVATALVALVALAQMYLGVEAPTDILVGVAVEVAIPLLGFRLLAPSQVFPISYRRGRSAHLDVGGAREQAIRQALQDQLGLVVEEVQPFGLAGSAGPRRCGSRSRATRPRSCSASCTPAATCAPTGGTSWAGLLYGRLEDEKPFNTVRRLVQQEDYALHKLYLAGLPGRDPTAWSSSPRNGSICWSPSSSTAPPNWARPRSTPR